MFCRCQQTITPVTVKKLRNNESKEKGHTKHKTAAETETVTRTQCKNKQKQNTLSTFSYMVSHWDF